MSLFQCQHCGCCENTALSAQGFHWLASSFDWSYAPERKGMVLCSACGPAKYRDGTPSEYGKWHNVFPRVFLPLGQFKTNDVGNLEHIESGSENYQQYALPAPEGEQA